MSQSNSREPTPTTEFHMIDEADLLNSDMDDSEIEISKECVNIKNTFMDKMHPLLDVMFKDMYNSIYTDCLDLILDEDKSVHLQEITQNLKSRCFELEDNSHMLEDNIAQLNTEIDGMNKVNNNLSLIREADRNTINSLTDKVRELSVLVVSLEDMDDKTQDQLQECISSLSEANKLIKIQGLEIEKLKREKGDMKEQIEDLCVLDTTGNNYHNLELLSNVCSVYHHEETNKVDEILNTSTSSLTLNCPEEDNSTIISEVSSYRKTLRSGKSYN